MKTINVDDDDWDRLHKLKLKYKFRSIKKLIHIMTKIIKKYDPEMRESK